MAKNNNIEVREFMRSHNIPQWKLAKYLLVCEATVQRTLRDTLPEDKFILYMETLKRIVSDRGKQALCNK